ncbi:unnamed protein product [Larinioides sclopetarius]|uniref:BTB domain-containing protein n=1 Tax=Larinioides sclopetarius TaxID=280406 RepID=A0AAV2B6Z4_9ARAC
MADKRGGFTIIWRIENYDFFIEKSGFWIFSPPFVVDSVKDTSWILRIVSNSIMRKQHLVFDIDRRALTAVELELDFEISLFNDKNHSPLFEVKHTHTYRSSHETFQCYVPQNQVYDRKGNELNPPKTLIIRCKMFRRKSCFPGSGQCFARTRIRVEKAAFVGLAEKFSSIVLGEKRTLAIKSASTEKQLLILKLSLSGDLCCKEKLWIEIIPIRKDYIKFCKCKLLLFDSEGVKIECGKNKFLFSDTEPKEWKFPLYFTKGYLMRGNAQFLSNDTLNLKFEFTFSTGIEYERIEDSEFGNLALVTENPPKLSSALEDITCLYEEGTLCDTKLQTATETFNAHKSILAARSSVFKTMFTTDMREKATDRVIIEDLEADTVSRMLMFLYSDKLEDPNWDRAKCLYFAADKYNIITLKQKCSDFLKNSLQLSNCCELLLLADKHKDEDLKKSVQDYMAQYQGAILRTEKWMDLEKSNPILVIETFRTMCLEK